MEHRHEFPVKKMCAVLQVSRSGYYKWLNRQASCSTTEDEIDLSIRKSFEASRQTYGSPRIALDLKNKGIKSSRSTVGRRMRKLGIRATRPKSWVSTTQSKHNDPVLLLQVLEDRYERAATVIVSQLPVAKWHAYLDEPTVADAILDRLLSRAHRIELKGESLRKRPEHLSS